METHRPVRATIPALADADILCDSVCDMRHYPDTARSVRGTMEKRMDGIARNGVAHIPADTAWNGKHRGRAVRTCDTQGIVQERQNNEIPPAETHGADTQRFEGDSMADA